MNDEVAAGMGPPNPWRVPESRAAVPTIEEPDATGAAPLIPVDYEDERVKKNSTLQIQWNSMMSEVQKNPSNYKAVSVLLISWHPVCDALKVHDEVDQLGKAFKSFNYNVSAVTLNSRSGPLPQVDAMDKVSSFVRKEDQEDSLLIIYYAGHGKLGNVAGQLLLFGESTTDDRTANDLEVLWNSVEAIMHTTRADVFEILDCCYAGDFGRDDGLKIFEPTRTENTTLSTRSFFYLGSTSAGSKARSPGHHSFTRALTYNLERFAKNVNSKFTIAELAERINHFHNFPPGQVPVLINRNPRSTEQIVLSALRPPAVPGDSQNKNPSETSPRVFATHYLDLRLFFTKEPGEPELKALAQALKRHICNHEEHLHKVAFMGVHSLIQRVLSRWTAKKSPKKPSTPRAMSGPGRVHMTTPESEEKGMSDGERKRQRNGRMEDEEERGAKHLKVDEN